MSNEALDARLVRVLSDVCGLVAVAADCEAVPHDEARRLIGEIEELGLLASPTSKATAEVMHQAVVDALGRLALDRHLRIVWADQ